MRYQPLPAEFHADNRKRLAEAIGAEAIAIIDTADALVRPGDFTYPYRPDSNFYYLTGLDEPDAILVLVPGAASESARELLFIKPTSDFTARWEGKRHSQSEAAERSGIQTVLWFDDLDRTLDRLLTKYRTIYLNAEESLESRMPSPAKRRATSLHENFPLHQLRSALPQLTQQRMVKAPVEVEQIRRAIAATHAGLLKAWGVTTPGLPEYSLEAEFIAECMRQGATAQAFSPIIASGAGTTIIHYTHNDATVDPGDLILFDVGAEAGYYAADISRTIPASGRYTKRQRILYEAVRRAQTAGVKLHKPGATIWDIDEAMRPHLLDGLVELGVITAAQAKAKDRFDTLHEYYGHISHHLGLDVHDNSDARKPFEPGMVVTCEPGLYLGEEGIGVRLEDDILITETGCEVLSKNIPSDPDEIESLIGPQAKK